VKDLFIPLAEPVTEVRFVLFDEAAYAAFETALSSYG
jgi:O-acetyl-ADP-ribose deacetylase (regulator of RNase III)